MPSENHYLMVLGKHWQPIKQSTWSSRQTVVFASHIHKLSRIAYAAEKAVINYQDKVSTIIYIFAQSAYYIISWQIVLDRWHYIKLSF